MDEPKYPVGLIMQGIKDSLVDKFLSRYHKPEDVISFEIRALAIVELDHALEVIRKECRLLGVEHQANIALQPVIDFLAHPEMPITRERLEYLYAMMKEYQLITQLRIDRVILN